MAHDKKAIIHENFISISTIPQEIFYNFFKHLDFKSNYSLLFVCKLFYLYSEAYFKTQYHNFRFFNINVATEKNSAYLLQYHDESNTHYPNAFNSRNPFTEQQKKLFMFIKDGDIHAILPLNITFADLLVQDNKGFSTLYWVGEIKDPNNRQALFNHFYNIIKNEEEANNILSKKSQMEIHWINLADAAIACHQPIDKIKALISTPSYAAEKLNQLQEEYRYSINTEYFYLNTAIMTNNLTFLNSGLVDYSSFNLHHDPSLMNDEDIKENNSVEILPVGNLEFRDYCMKIKWPIDTINKYCRTEIFEIFLDKEKSSTTSLSTQIIKHGSLDLFKKYLPAWVEFTKGHFVKNPADVWRYEQFLSIFHKILKEKKPEMLKVFLTHMKDVDFNNFIIYCKRHNVKLINYYKILAPVLIEQNCLYGISVIYTEILPILSKSNLIEFEKLLTPLTNGSLLALMLQNIRPTSDEPSIFIEEISTNIIKQALERTAVKNELLQLLIEFLKLFLKKNNNIGKNSKLLTVKIFLNAPDDDESDEEENEEFLHFEIIHHAVQTKNVELVELLLEFTLPTSYIHYNAPDKQNGKTPLFYAVEGGDYPMVKLLLEKGNADPDEKNKDGKTPISLAIENKHLPIFVLLKSTKDAREEKAKAYHVSQQVDFEGTSNIKRGFN